MKTLRDIGQEQFPCAWVALNYMPEPIVPIDVVGFIDDDKSVTGPLDSRHKRDAFPRLHFQPIMRQSARSLKLPHVAWLDDYAPTGGLGVCASVQRRAAVCCTAFCTALSCSHRSAPRTLHLVRVSESLRIRLGILASARKRHRCL